MSADTPTSGRAAGRLGEHAPSVILLRLAGERGLSRGAAMILANQPQVMDLEAGAMVVIEEGRVRSRRPPSIPE